MNDTFVDGGLSLSGIIAARGKYVALLALDGGAAEVVNEGALLGRYGVLRKILADRILVERDGIVRTVRVSSGLRTHEPSGAEGVAGTDGSIPGTVPISYPPGPLPASLGGPAEAPYILSRDDLQTGLSPFKVAGQAKMAVYPEGGFQFVEVQEGSLLEKLGVQPGDVVRSVNNRQLVGLADVMAVQDLLPTAEWVKVEIVRAGETQIWEQKIRN